MRRYAAKVDSSQQAIVDALRSAGCLVFIIGQPVDLLCRYWDNTLRRFLWQPIECKPPANKRNDPRRRKDQQSQTEFIARNDIPVVVTPEQALRAVGVI